MRSETQCKAQIEVGTNKGMFSVDTSYYHYLPGVEELPCLNQGKAARSLERIAKNREMAFILCSVEDVEGLQKEVCQKPLRESFGRFTI